MQQVLLEVQPVGEGEPEAEWASQAESSGSRGLEGGQLRTSIELANRKWEDKWR